MFDIYQLVIMVTMVAMTVSPLVAFNIKQKSKVEKLENDRDNLKEALSKHVEKSEYLEKILLQHSESITLIKYIIDEIKRKNGNGNGEKRSAV